jgi:hypothetical protein
MKKRALVSMTGVVSVARELPDSLPFNSGISFGTRVAKPFFLAPLERLNRAA